MTHVSCQKIWGSIPGSPKWSDDSWRLCICKVPTPAPSPREGRANRGQSMRAFTFFTSHTQQTMISCFQGREEWTNSNPRRPLHYLLLILNKQRLLFPREGRMNWKQFMRAFTLFTSHTQQATPLVSKGGKSEQRAIHAGFYIPYFTYSTTTPFCFQGRGEWTKGIPREPLHHLLLIFNK